jgi:hypothetical protein
MHLLATLFACVHTLHYASPIIAILLVMKKIIAEACIAFAASPVIAELGTAY